MQNELKMSNAGAEADRGLAVRFENHTEDRLIGRRDMLIGLWAGAQLGLPEGSRTITRCRSWRPA